MIIGCITRGTYERMTAIHEGAPPGHMDVTEFLAQGDDVYTCTKAGQSALQLVPDYRGKEHKLDGCLEELGALNASPEL